jgi:hypothetical protein
MRPTFGVFSEYVKRFWKPLMSFALVVAGIFSAAFGPKGFLLSSLFIDGGVTGSSMYVC